MEILVADGASDDGTVDVIRSLDRTGRVRVLANPQRIQAAGLNLAIHQARGDVVVRVDGHTVIAPDYVNQCVTALASTGAATVGGRMDPLGITPMGEAIALAGTTPFAVPSAFHVSSAAQFTDTVYMGAWPRGVLLEVGGFDERLRTNEDYELNYRIRRNGGRIFLTPAIRSTYLCRQTLPALARQYARYGTGKAHMLREHPTSVRPRQLVAPAFVAFLAGSLALWTLLPSFLHLLIVALLATYGLLSVAFSVSAASAAHRYRLLWRLPLVFLTLHLAWGGGFWWGALMGVPWSSRTPHQRLVPEVMDPAGVSGVPRAEDRHGL
jgi:cellulose synthase/poly-beta-1,6-N-acetylglucosamine synthase-like glycosyltransferase